MYRGNLSLSATVKTLKRRKDSKVLLTTSYLRQKIANPASSLRVSYIEKQHPRQSARDPKVYFLIQENHNIENLLTLYMFK